MTCKACRENIALYRDGLLDSGRHRQVDAHLASCMACAAEVRSDERLAGLLGAVPCAEPSPISWASIQARRPEPERPGFAWKPALAVTAFALAFMLFEEDHQPQQPLLPPTPRVVRAPEPQVADPFVSVHELLSAYDTGGDPNRAILAAQAQTASERGH